MERINEWNAEESNRAERSWGHIRKPYTIDMFEFLQSRAKSFLDLGCGFGRFLEFLKESHEEPNYIGYDSSQAMVARTIDRFPEYALQVFCKNLTQPITHPQQGILIHAVLIHVIPSDQEKILKNVKVANPKFLTFDINYLDKQIKNSESFVTLTRNSEVKFRMTWQPHDEMTEMVKVLFPNYDLTTKIYKLRAPKKKVAYFLERH